MLYLVRCTALSRIRILGMSTYLSVGTRRISRGRMTMLLSLIFSLLASTSAQTTADPCPFNPNSASCDDPVNGTICQLTCNRISGECAQADEEKCGKIGVDDMASYTYVDMFNSTLCFDICVESRDESTEEVCRFYKLSVSLESIMSTVHPSCE